MSDRITFKTDTLLERIAEAAIDALEDLKAITDALPCADQDPEDLVRDLVSGYDFSAKECKRLQSELDAANLIARRALVKFDESDAKRDALRAVVQDLEWSGITDVDSPEHGEIEIFCCPICGACKEGSEAGDGVHVEDCTLRAALEDS